VYRAEIEAAKATGGYVDPRSGRILFRTYAQRWLDGRLGIAETTAAGYASYLRSLILPTLGDHRIDQIGPDDLRVWIAQLDRDGSAPATIRKALTVVRQILGRAVTDRRITVNPADVGDMDLPAQRRKTMTILSAAEIVDLVAAAGPFFGTHFLTAASTGLRWGELAGLPIDNLDVLRGEIRVETQLREIAGRLTLGVPLKTESSRRIVTIPRSVAERIGEHLGRFPNDSGVVFSSVEGKLLRRSNFRRAAMKRAATEIGRPQLTFHDLRHTHASLLLAEGEPITNVSARLGHRDAATTLRIYAHALEGSERSASDRFEAILRENVGYSRDERPAEGDLGTVSTVGA
jgi:integrase